MILRNGTRWMGRLSLSLGLFLLAPLNRLEAGVINLGTANAYNVFSLGDDTQSNTDAQGRVAVGGNANFAGSGYTIASNRSGTTTTNLVVGGNYSNTYNTVYGSVAIGGNAAINGPTINGNLTVGGSLGLAGYGSVNGNVLYGTTYANSTTTVTGTVARGSSTLPVNFTSERSYLTNLSTALMNAASTGTATFTGNSATNTMGQFTLTGTSTTSNVFHIKGSDLALTNGLTINAPAGATVVVDIDGTADSMQNFGFSYSGVDKQHVLFNFANATSLGLSGIGVQGSILAVNAATSFSNGSIDGTLVVGSVTGGGESHDFMFQGDLSSIVGPGFGTPAAMAVPEPSSVVMALMGLALVGGVTARRRA